MPGEITVKVLGLPEFDGALTAMVLRVKAASGLALEQAARRVIQRVHGHMDGRPGPYRRTGALFGSLRADPVVSGGGSPGRVIYPSTPYARRIELGFHGADSLGRMYNQQPYPYFFPGVEESIDSGELERVMATAWGGAMR